MDKVIKKLKGANSDIDLTNVQLNTSISTWGNVDYANWKDRKRKTSVFAKRV